MAACSRLCVLVSRSLLPYVEAKPLRLTKESEKDLLLSLTTVSREIQKWVSERDCNPEQEEVVNQTCDYNCSQFLDQPLEGSFSCVASIVSVLVALLSFDSSFVQHLSGNVLAAVSHFLSRYESQWVQFLHLLWISIETAISSIHSCTLSYSEFGHINPKDETLTHLCIPTEFKAHGAENSAFEVVGFLSVLSSRLVSPNWLLVGGLFQSLRNILKSLKNEYVACEEMYTHIAVSALLKLPWDLLTEINVSQMALGQTRPRWDNLSNKLNGLSESKHVLLGYILQVFCSVSDHKDSEEAGENFLEELSIYSRFTSLIPKLLSFCLSKCLDSTKNSLSQYLRHKALMLMIRLSFHIHWQSTCPLIWLQLLREYFEDLLFEPISDKDAGVGNSLDDSPFLTRISDGDKVHSICTRHLQRQTIYLLFKCCFSLVHMYNDTLHECTCATAASSSTFELQHGSKDCQHMVPLLLSEWFKKCALLDIFVDNESYSRSCRSFALSFLQLYMEEDDMLFQMLLQLLDDPFLTLQLWSNVKERFFEEVDKEVFFCMSNIFNPIHLFHLFLSLLHYDHLVLVDYLISKDVGIDCVHYLLRCLRIICNSWTIFADVSIYNTEMNPQWHKKRKRSSEFCNWKAEPSSLSTAAKIGRAHESLALPTYENAKACLLALKRSVEEFHKKSLFPYNPRPLLKRQEEKSFKF